MRYNIRMATSKKTTKSASTRVTKKTVKKPTVNRAVAARADRVDYYPNRMTVAVSALAGTILVLVAVISVLGSR